MPARARPVTWAGSADAGGYLATPPVGRTILDRSLNVSEKSSGVGMNFRRPAWGLARSSTALPAGVFVVIPTRRDEAFVVRSDAVRRSSGPPGDTPPRRWPCGHTTNKMPLRAHYQHHALTGTPRIATGRAGRLARPGRFSGQGRTSTGRFQASHLRLYFRPVMSPATRWPACPLPLGEGGRG